MFNQRQRRRSSFPAQPSLGFEKYWRAPVPDRSTCHSSVNDTLDFPWKDGDVHHTISLKKGHTPARIVKMGIHCRILHMCAQTTGGSPVGPSNAALL